MRREGENMDFVYDWLRRKGVIAEAVPDFRLTPLVQGFIDRCAWAEIHPYGHGFRFFRWRLSTTRKPCG